MPQPRFLLDDPITGPGSYALNRYESHHVTDVLRFRAGDVIIVFDGRGNHAEAAIEEAGRHGVRVRVDEVHREEHLPLALTLATAIPKGKRWQILVEKCTELGVDRIIPMLTERSVAKGEGDMEKWRRWVIEAAKQSRRSWVPEVCEPMPIAGIPDLARNENALLLLADASGDSPGAFRDVMQRAGRVVVMVGPEGGFTGQEVEECVRQGARTICLSPFVLRIETAAATVCAIVREALL